MAGLLQYEGSVLPESVRRAAQAAMWDTPAVSMEQARLAQEAASAKAAQGAKSAGWAEGQRNVDFKGMAGKAGGLLSTAGKALGGAGAVYELGTGANEKYGMGAWENAQDLANKRDVRLAVEADPGLPMRGVQSVKDISGRAVESARGLIDQFPKQDARRTEGLSMLPMTPEKKAEAAEMVKDPQVEADRQRLQAGTLKGLQTGEVHVSQLAQGVVQADEQRSGTELKPDEKKEAIKTEIAAMKTMDRNQLSEYVSYALMAGGILASIFDKTGTAGQMFHDSFNRQLDRNLESGKMSAQQQQAAAKLALDQEKADTTKADVNSKIKSREVGAGQKDRELGQGDKRLGILETDSKTKAYSANESAAAARARLGLLSESNDLRRLDTESKIKARQHKMDNPTAGKGDQGTPLSYKDNAGVVSDVYKSQGLKLDPALQSQIAARMPTLQKKYPQLSAAELVELAAGEYDTEVDEGWFNDTARIKKPK